MLWPLIYRKASLHFLAVLHKPSADEFDIVKHCNSVSGAEWPQTTRSLLCGHEMTY